MKKNRPHFVNKYLVPPVAYIRSQILYKIFNRNEGTNTNFRNKIYHFRAYLRSIIFSYDNKKTNLFIVGGQKCGTTALHGYLDKHPLIQSGLTKELHYFDYSDYFKQSNKRENFKHLRAFFPKNLSNETLLIDSSPNYSWMENIIERIHHYNKSAKLILILRNPIDRAFSQWNMQSDLKITLDSFENSIAREMNRKNKRQSRALSYLDRGLYSRQIENIWKIFGKGSLHIILSEDLRKNTASELKKIYSFLDLEVPIKSDFSSINSNKRFYRKKLDTKTREKLKDFFKEEIINLEKMINRDLSHWRN